MYEGSWWRLLVAVMWACAGTEPDSVHRVPPCLDEWVGYLDGDGDGFGLVETETRLCGGITGWVALEGDCDDTDGQVHPTALERCNGLDDDCDPATDEDALLGTAWSPDEDRDGFGDPAVVVVACARPEGWVEDDRDCDDADPSVHPGSTDGCNGGVDDDCDPGTDEDELFGDAWFRDVDGDGWGGEEIVLACEQPPDGVELGGDCRDGDPEVNPGATERCNDGVDDDCNPETEEDVLAGTDWHADGDGDGYGDPERTVRACSRPLGFVEDASDCNDLSADVHPGAEEIQCDGTDQNCVPDDDGILIWYVDGDGDGYGDPETAWEECNAGRGVDLGGDCDDGDPSIHPGAEELCDAIDQDCSPLTPVDPCGPTECVEIDRAGTYSPALRARVSEHPRCWFDEKGPDGHYYRQESAGIARLDGATCDPRGLLVEIEAGGTETSDTGCLECWTNYVEYVAPPAFSGDGKHLFVGRFESMDYWIVDQHDLDGHFERNVLEGWWAPFYYLMHGTPRGLWMSTYFGATVLVDTDTLEVLTTAFGTGEPWTIIEVEGVLHVLDDWDSSVRRFDAVTGVELTPLVPGGGVRYGGLGWMPMQRLWVLTAGLRVQEVHFFDERGTLLLAIPAESELMVKHSVVPGPCP